MPGRWEIELRVSPQGWITGWDLTTHRDELKLTKHRVGLWCCSPFLICPSSLYILFNTSLSLQCHYISLLQASVSLHTLSISCRWRYNPHLWFCDCFLPSTVFPRFTRLAACIPALLLLLWVIFPGIDVTHVICLFIGWWALGPYTFFSYYI